MSRINQNLLGERQTYDIILLPKWERVRAINLQNLHVPKSRRYGIIRFLFEFLRNLANIFTFHLK